MNIVVLISFGVGLELTVSHFYSALGEFYCLTSVLLWWLHESFYDKKSTKSGASNSKKQKAFLILS